MRIQCSQFCRIPDSETQGIPGLVFIVWWIFCVKEMPKFIFFYLTNVPRFLENLDTPSAI